MTNIFMNQVKDAISFSWKYIFKYFKFRRSYKKFCKNIKIGSPSFGVLWNFSEFIQYAEIVYCYDNNKNNVLYSSKDYIIGQRGFKIYTDEMIITCKLWSDNQKVGIDVENKNGNKLKTSYEFINGNWTKEPDDYDILHIDRIIGIINHYMLYLLTYCINKKLHYLDEK